MRLADEYRRQLAWRSWETILEALPPIAGQTVVDLGCAIGDQAALLASRGARVVGVDANEELLAAARRRGIAGAEFVNADLRAAPDLGTRAHGLWSSFTAAYFPDLAPVMTVWRRLLRRGGWVAVTEVDDLFGHEPLRDETRQALRGYAAEALRAGRYDFLMGRKLAGHLLQAGFSVGHELDVPDRELAFQGPASRDVMDAWSARFERMRLLKEFCGEAFPRVRQDFLGSLARDDHRSTTRVVCCIGTGAGPGSPDA